MKNAIVWDGDSIILLKKNVLDDINFYNISVI